MTLIEFIEMYILSREINPTSITMIVDKGHRFLLCNQKTVDKNKDIFTINDNDFTKLGDFYYPNEYFNYKVGHKSYIEIKTHKLYIFVEKE